MRDGPNSNAVKKNIRSELLSISHGKRDLNVFYVKFKANQIHPYGKTIFQRTSHSNKVS